MSLIHRKRLVMSKIPVAHSYRYKDLFQISPPPEGAPLPRAMIGHYPFVLEFVFDSPDEERSDPNGRVLPKYIGKNEVASQTTKEIMLILTALTTNTFFQYSSRQSWFLPTGTRDQEIPMTDKASVWGQEMYSLHGYGVPDDALDGDEFFQATEETIPLIDPNTYFNRFGRGVEDTLDLPDSITDSLDKYYQMNEEAKKAFLSSCSLFTQGQQLWGDHQSLSFASVVSALETLIHFDHKEDEVETCATCGQNRHRVLAKFKEFLQTYGSRDPKFKKFAEKVYKYRSKILHQGELFLGEIEPIRFASFDGMEDRDLHRMLNSTCRICMNNWIVATR